MRRLLMAVVVLSALSVSAEASAQTSCATVKPGASWVCVNGGWLPPGIAPTPVPVPAPYPKPLDPYKVQFRIGSRYIRGTSDLFIVALGQARDGTPVLMAECVDFGEGCYFPGMGRILLANASTAGWTEIPR